MTMPPTKDILIFSAIGIAAFAVLKLSSSVSNAVGTVAGNTDFTAIGENATDDVVEAGTVTAGAVLGGLAVLLLL